MADLAIKRNDLSPALEIVCRDGVGPVDLDGATALIRMTNVLTGAVKIPNGTPGSDTGTPATSIPFTVNATTNVLTANGHGLVDGRDVTAKSTGTLPGGMNPQKRYYAINADANTLQLALVVGGSAIEIESNGTGTHSLLTGIVSREWVSGDTDTAGTYFAEAQVTIGGKPLTYPNDRQLLIEVVSDLA